VNVQMLQLLILGLMLGGVYAVMASGMTLIFGVMRIVNLAHATFILFAAFLAFYLFEGLGIDPIVSLVIIIPTMFLFGVAVYLLLFPRIENSPRFVESTVLLTFGLALVAEGLMSRGFTGSYRIVKPSYGTQAFLVGDLYIPKGQFYALIVSGVLLLGLTALLYGTRIGGSIRATMQNRTAAQIVGVNVRRTMAISFGVGIALAGASGALLSFLFPFFPASHWEWVPIMLALVVLGGLGSLKGALIGSLTLSVAAAFVMSEFGPTWQPMTFFLALFLILLVRPQGLYGTPLEA
jgi:branched-chain amino acid transport system permease protein